MIAAAASTRPFAPPAAPTGSAHERNDHLLRSACVSDGPARSSRGNANGSSARDWQRTAARASTAGTFEAPPPKTTSPRATE